MAYESKNYLEANSSDRELLKERDKYFEEAKNYRDQYRAEWEEAERFYEGQHWQNIDSRPVNNRIWAVVETAVPVLTDARPGTSVISVEDENNLKSQVLKEAIDFVYNKNTIDIRLSQAVRSAQKTGTGFIYVGYDPDLDGGKGEIVIKTLPWRWVYLDPSAGEIDDMSYIIIRMPMKVDNLKRLSPENAEQIRPEDIETYDDNRTNLMLDPTRDSFSYNNYNSNFAMFKPTDMAYYYECWKKDYTMVKIDEEETLAIAAQELDSILQGIAPEAEKYQDHAALIQIHMQNKQSFIEGAIQDPNPETQVLVFNAVQQDENFNLILQLFDDVIAQHQTLLEQNPNGEKPKYKNFIRVTVSTSNVVLFDGESPTDDKMFPISPIYTYKEEEKPYGVGTIKNLLSPQKVYNDLNYAEYKSLLLNSNPGWLKDELANVNDESLTNEQGLVVTIANGGMCQRLPPGQTNPQLGMKQQELIADIEYISGLNASLRGEKPAGITAARAIESLQQQSLARLRLQSRNIEHAMIRLGKLVLSRIFTYWTSKKVLKVYDDNGTLQGMTFNPEDYDQTMYEVRVSPGSTFGLSKEVVLEQTTPLVQQGLIDPKTYIKLNDFPYKNTILADIEQRDALAAENEQLKNMIAQLQGVGGQPAPQSQTTPQGGPVVAA